MLNQCPKCGGFMADERRTDPPARECVNCSYVYNPQALTIEQARAEVEAPRKRARVKAW